MDTYHNRVLLTAAEVSYLWSTYLADSMAVCVFQYFLTHVEDPDVERLVSFAKGLSQQHVDTVQGIFNDEGIKVPQGFTKKDVNLKAKRLFSDKFYLFYLKNMAKGGLTTNSSIVPTIFRPDILIFFTKCLTDSLELNNIVTNVLLEKGLAVRPPTIPYPKKVEFVHKQSFILEGLGKRPLSGMAVTNLYTNIQTNLLGTSLATAFSQVAHSKKVKEYILRGKEIAIKHIQIFSDYLKSQSMPIPMSFDQEVTESIETPFSEKLMMFHFSLMIYSGVGNYGTAISQSQRSDQVIDYSRLIVEVLKYAEDGMNIMIANKWFEQPPLSADRKGLAGN